MFKGKFENIVLPNEGFLRGPFGSALKKSLFVPKAEDTYKVYEQSVVLQEDKTLGEYYISKKYFEENLSRFEVKSGDFLVSCSGVNYGAIYQLKGEIDKGVINQALLRIRINPEIVDENYFLYYFRTYIVKKITGGTGDSTIPNFPPMSVVKEIDIQLPNINVQRKIGKVLAEIDDKIKNNNEINIELESVAKTIYNYWFLQFEFPNVNGKPYKSSGGEMVWNEELKKEIPKGWEVSNLANSILKSKNGDWGNEEPINNDDIKVNCFRGADFISITKSHDMTAPIRYIKKSNSDRLLEDGDLVTEISGGSPTQATGRIGYINQGFLNRSENVMDCSNFCKAFTPIDKKYQFWLYQTWKSYYDNGAMFNYESKTTGIKNLMFDDFIDSIYVAYPISELLMKFQEICGTFYDKIQKNLLENQELASLRDFLLPLLMNGQVGFKE